MDNKNKILLDNKFLIKSLIGKGATSRVFLVEDSEKKRLYAAKVLLEYSPQYFKLFNNEKEILNHLKEKNIPDIINIIESGEDR
jgi:serine/threonine protein kinase